MAAVKVSLHSLSELKTTIDDHLPVYLSTSQTPSGAPLPRTLRFTPSHIYTLIRLVLGYMAVAIALYIFYLDYIVKKDFNSYKDLTLWAVVLYCSLNAILQGWIWFVEAGVVFMGERTGKDNKTTSIRVHSLNPKKKYEPTYRMRVVWDINTGDGRPLQTFEAEKSAPFTRFYTSEGYFSPAAFEAWLCKELPIIDGGNAGAADVVTDKSSASTMTAKEATAEDDDLVLISSPGPAPVTKKSKRK